MFKMSSFTLDFEKKKLLLNSRSYILGDFFLNTLLFFVIFLIFSLFYSQTKKIAKKTSQYTLDFEKKALAIDCLGSIFEYYSKDLKHHIL